MTVQEHHLDTNHHVNNVQYVRLALSALPEGLEISRCGSPIRSRPIWAMSCCLCISDRGGPG